MLVCCDGGIHSCLDGSVCLGLRLCCGPPSLHVLGCQITKTYRTAVLLCEARGREGAGGQLRNLHTAGSVPPTSDDPETEWFC